MIPQWIIDLPWEMFNTLISLMELLVLSVPAAVIFMYYRIQSVNLYVAETTNNGATILIHNRTNRSVFISDVQFIATANSDFGKPVVFWDKSASQIKPDDCLEVVVNYTRCSRGNQAFQFLVRYDRKRIKKIKVKV
jgi:hypothetical protein